jgi:hypothetical protein
MKLSAQRVPEIILKYQTLILGSWTRHDGDRAILLWDLPMQANSVNPFVGPWTMRRVKVEEDMVQSAVHMNWCQNSLQRPNNIAYNNNANTVEKEGSR